MYIPFSLSWSKFPETLTQSYELMIFLLINKNNHCRVACCPCAVTTLCTYGKSTKKARSQCWSRRRNTSSVWKKGTYPKFVIWANVAGGRGMTEEMLLLKRDSFICFHCVPCQCMKDTEKLFVTWARVSILRLV